MLESYFNGNSLNSYFLNFPTVESSVSVIRFPPRVGVLSCELLSNAQPAVHRVHRGCTFLRVRERLRSSERKITWGADTEQSGVVSQLPSIFLSDSIFMYVSFLTSLPAWSVVQRLLMCSWTSWVWILVHCPSWPGVSHTPVYFSSKSTQQNNQYACAILAYPCFTCSNPILKMDTRCISVWQRPLLEWC